MKLLLIIISILANNWLFSQDSISVLFLGNSYTYYNDLPTLLVNIAESKGDILTVDSRTQGGASFATHAGSTETYTLIHSKPWDFVVLQGQSQEPAFPDAQVNTSSIPFAQQIADTVYASNFCTDLMLFMTWGYLNGDAQWEPISTYEGMQGRLRNAYERIADSCQASVSPVGMAWKYARENFPEINLYSGDGSHPSYEGSYLAACTFYASLYRKSPVGASFIGNISPVNATKLQQAAEIAVMDSLSQWQLRPFENHTIADFTYSVNQTTLTTTNLSWKAQSYAWNFGDGMTSDVSSPIHNYSSNGNYEVTLSAMSECNSDEKSVAIEITTADQKELEKINATLKTIEPGLFELVFTENNRYSIQVIDALGKMVKVVRQKSDVIHIDLRNHSRATYFLSIENKRIKLVY